MTCLITDNKIDVQHLKVRKLPFIQQKIRYLTLKYSDALEVENGGNLTKLQKNFHNRFTSNADLIMISRHELYLSYTASLT